MDLLALVDDLATGLATTAIRHGERCCWLAPTVVAAGDRWDPVEQTGDPTLYDGSAGIAVACAAVGVHPTAGRPELVELAVAGARHALSRVPALPTNGLFDGRAGIGLAAIVVGAASGDDGLRQEGEAVLDRAGGSAIAAPPGPNDLTSGIAGIVVALVRAAELTTDPHWSASAVTLADVLAERATHRPWGASWPADSGGDRAHEPDLCGLAHGVSGSLVALGLAAAASGEPDRYDELMAEARQYERSWFDPARNDWPDLRGWNGTGPPPRPTRWCHGSAGIGLSRAGLVRATGLDGTNPALLGELAAALQSTCAGAERELAAAEAGSGLPAGLTVCHGLGGAVELLAEATSVLGEPVHLDTARRLVGRAVGILGGDVVRWPGGVREMPGPGLMNGMAGTMALLVRLADPDGIGGPGLLGLAGSVPGVPPREDPPRP